MEENRNQSHFTPRRHADHGTNEGGKKYLATALELLIALGFVVNTKMCVTHPDQVMEFLGFVLDSRISLLNWKLRSLQKTASKLKLQGTGSMSQLVQLLRMMVAAHPVILPAPLHYWRNQVWYPSLLKNLTDYPIPLPPVQNILIGPEGESHPLVLQGHLPLATLPISGDLSGNHGGPQQSAYSSAWWQWD